MKKIITTWVALCLCAAGVQRVNAQESLLFHSAFESTPQMKGLLDPGPHAKGVHYQIVLKKNKQALGAWEGVQSNDQPVDLTVYFDAKSNAFKSSPFVEPAEAEAALKESQVSMAVLGVFTPLSNGQVAFNYAFKLSTLTAWTRHEDQGSTSMMPAYFKLGRSETRLLPADQTVVLELGEQERRGFGVWNPKTEKMELPTERYQLEVRVFSVDKIPS